VVLTSNRTREVHDALSGAASKPWLDHPDLAQEIAILRSRLPGLPERLAAQVARRGPQDCAQELDLLKPPGVAESLDWHRRCKLLGARERTWNARRPAWERYSKSREDADRVRAQLDAGDGP